MRYTLSIFSLFFLIQCHAQPQAYPLPDAVRLTDSVDCTSVKDQGLSPTCWVFGTNSLFESDLIKEYGIRLNLSEMFIARHAYIDKARQFLRSGGKTYFEGGGQFHDVIRVLQSHGMVPDEVYSGRAGEKKSHDHASLDSSMQRMLKQWLQKGEKELTDAAIRQLNDTLDHYLGTVPESFSWQGRQYTPRSFADEILRFRNQYVELVSFADKPLYRQFILADKYNWANDSFWNISLSDMQSLVDTALANGWSVGWEGDVTEKGFNHMNGYASLADSAYSYDAQRLQDYQSEVTERDHMLHLVGAGKDTNGRKWYYLKNSWGTWLSRYKGYLYMNENYFRMKTVILFVHQKALPPSLKTKLGIND